MDRKQKGKEGLGKGERLIRNCGVGNEKNRIIKKIIKDGILKKQKIIYILKNLNIEKGRNCMEVEQIEYRFYI